MKTEPSHSATGSRVGTTWRLSLGNMLFTLVAIAFYAIVANVNSADALQWRVAQSSVGTTLPYAGYLEDNNGTPVAGAHDVSIAIYDAPTVGALVWGPETHVGVPFINGNFVLDAGSITTGGIPAALLNGSSYAEVVIAGETLTPRTRVTATMGGGNRSWFTSNSGNDYRTQSTTFAAVPEMSLTIETSGKPVHITYDAGFSILNPNAPNRFVAFAIYVDGEEKNRHAQRVFSPGQGTNAQIHWVGDLAPGEHLVEIMWRVNEDDVIGRTAYNAWERNFLVVTELNQ